MKPKFGLTVNRDFALKEEVLAFVKDILTDMEQGLTVGYGWEIETYED